MSLAALSISEETTDKDWKVISNEFETASPEAVLRWAIEEFSPDVALATGFGAEGCVLVAMLSAIRPGTRIFISIQTCSSRRPTLCGINSKRATAFTSSGGRPASRLAIKLLNTVSGCGSVSPIFAAVFAKWNR